MILYLQSDGDTTINFDVPLEYLHYGIGVVRIDGKITASKNKDLYLCCDIIEESYLGNKKMPILYPIKRDSKNTVITLNQKVLYLRIARPSISSIRLYICNEEGEIISLARNVLKCILLIVPGK